MNEGFSVDILDTVVTFLNNVNKMIINFVSPSTCAIPYIIIIIYNILFEVVPQLL